MDDWLLGQGADTRLYDHLGAHTIEHEGVRGVHFAVWAPHARRVSVVGEFNAWDGRRHAMRKRVDTGVWEIFLPGVDEGALYKYEIIGADGTLLAQKADPVGFGAELRPSTASVVRDTAHFAWHDGAWMAARAAADAIRAPMSIYEVHLGSWRRGEHGRWLTYDELADTLIPYAVDMGFTHLELTPVSEYPYDPSWGYQPVGLFAPTSRFGEPAAFARFIDRAHQAGLGVILDWVPAHFPTDPHGLAWFDGTALYEHADPRRGLHPDWNTAIYDFGRREVVNYLIANALYWFERYHVDGLRVDAVASMLYLDYSREPGEWLPNREGGNQNLDAVAFLRQLNETVYAQHTGVMMIAEESTAWPGVSHPTFAGGLGFGFKWNMGWMHDTLAYVKKAPVHRRWHHDLITFGLTYAFAENFVLPLSHDEVVHGKGSLLGKMPGDAWQQFATLRAYYGLMWAYPGKKLLFMGQEFAQGREWNFAESLDWNLLDLDQHRGVQAVVRDCNAAYRAHAGAARAGQRRRRLPLDRRRRPAALGVRVAAVRPGRGAARGGRRQLHRGAARGVPYRSARGRTLARDPQHRRAGLRRVEPRQRGRRVRGGDPEPRPAMLGGADGAAAGDGVAAGGGRLNRPPARDGRRRRWTATPRRSPTRRRSRARRWRTCWPAAAARGCTN